MHIIPSLTSSAPALMGAGMGGFSGFCTTITMLQGDNSNIPRQEFSSPIACILTGLFILVVGTGVGIVTGCATGAFLATAFGPGAATVILAFLLSSTVAHYMTKIVVFLLALCLYSVQSACSN